MIFKTKFREIGARLDARIGIEDKNFSVKFTNLQRVEVSEDTEYYTGAYDITPTVAAQTMATAHKMMTKDVTIKAIPFFDVTNAGGGKTVYIAKEI